jgi:HK97 family phage prohead protease
MTEAERRFTASVVEIRAEQGAKRIGGFAAKFEKRSQNLGGFREKIDPKFFNKSRGDGWPDVLARYNHDDNMLLGTTGAQTLDLTIKREGLWYEVSPPQSRADVVELVERGDVRKSSFAFRAFEDDWELDDDDTPLRTLITGQLVDVAPVNTPAYLDTSTGLRSLAEKVQAPLEEVRSLAEQGELKRFLKPTPGGEHAVRKALARAQELQKLRESWA